MYNISFSGAVKTSIFPLLFFYFISFINHPPFAHIYAKSPN